MWIFKNLSEFNINLYLGTSIPLKITSQVPVQGWYEIIGEKTIADAILDRLIHNSHRIELKGESMRRKRKKLIEEND